MVSTGWTSCQAFVLGSGVRDPLQTIEFGVHSLPGGLASALTTLKRERDKQLIYRGDGSACSWRCVLTRLLRAVTGPSLVKCVRPKGLTILPRASWPLSCAAPPPLANVIGGNSEAWWHRRSGCTTRTKWVEPLGNEGWFESHGMIIAERRC